MDPSRLRQLFLQRLLINVRRILVSTAKGSMLQELAEMADRVMEVISPSIVMVATPPAISEVGQLQAEVARLEKQLLAL